MVDSFIGILVLVDIRISDRMLSTDLLAFSWRNQNFMKEYPNKGNCNTIIMVKN